MRSRMVGSFAFPVLSCVDALIIGTFGGGLGGLTPRNVSRNVLPRATGDVLVACEVTSIHAPNVPMIKAPAQDNTGNAKEPTMRERMEMHHQSPTCAGCHSLFEPIGIALENFDAIGAWRLQDEGQPIDPKGSLADGTKIDGPKSLRDYLARNPEQF